MIEPLLPANRKAAPLGDLTGRSEQRLAGVPPNLIAGVPHVQTGANPAGDYVRISVTDNGSGMTDEVKQHLFEPFFTTKDEGQGTGLGLATSYGIVRQSGGHICVESELGQGTTVRIFLPRVPAPPPPSYKKPGAKKLHTGSETILVLEDDIGVRHLSVRVLRSLGYDVLEAANSDDAQLLIGARVGKKIDLLLTDVVMPGQNGRKLAEAARARQASLKVLYMTGYSRNAIVHQGRLDPGVELLQKPLTSGQLAATVRKILDA